MSENFERIELDSKELDSIVGGKLVWLADHTAKIYNVYAPNTPDVVYGVKMDNVRNAMRYEALKCHGKSDEEVINELLAQGLIFKL